MKIKSSSKLFGWLFRKLSTSPYDGYIYFTFGINPYKLHKVKEPYVSDEINKEHFKILAYRFVSRIVWNGEYSKQAVDKMLKAKLQFGYIVVNNGGIVAKQLGLPIKRIEAISKFPNYRSGVFNDAEEYVGSIRYAWTFIRDGYIPARTSPVVFFHPQRKEYYGGTNYFGKTFKVGDMNEQGEVITTLGEAKREAVKLVETLLQQRN